jgi:hypothetical protein
MMSYLKNISGEKTRKKVFTITIGILMISLLFFSPRSSPGSMVGILVKIPIQNEQDLNRLQGLGVEPLVIEEDYVVVRAREDERLRIEEAGFVILKAQEQDLIRRLIKIRISSETSPEARKSLARVGLDVWKAKEDYMIAQAFDNQIRELQKSGFVVEILYRNAKEYFNK